MNTYKKGKLLENKAEQKLKELGYSIYFKSIRIRFQSVDFAGLFDIVASKDKRWYFIQVKSRFDRKQWDKIQQWAIQKAPTNSHSEMWVWNEHMSEFDIHTI